MKFVVDPQKLGAIGAKLLVELNVLRAAGEMVDKGPPPNLPTYTFRSIVTPKMRAQARKARKRQKASRQRNRYGRAGR